MTRRDHFATCASLALFAAAHGAAAQTARVPRTRVTVEHPSCAPNVYDEASYLSLLGAELRMDGVSEIAEAPLGEHSSTSVARLRLERPRCVPDETTIVVHLVDPLTDKSLARGVDLSATSPAARSRVLALASAELLRASWAEVADARRRTVVESVIPLGNGVHVSVRTEPVPPPSIAQPKPTPSSAWFLGPTVELRHHLQHPSGMWFAGGRAGWRSKSVQLAGDLRAGYARAGDSLGELYIATISAGGTVALRSQSENIAWALGPRMEVGGALAGGAGAAKGVQTGEGAAPIVQLAMDAELQLRSTLCAPHFGLRVGETMAAIAVGVDGKRALGMDGPFVGVTFGADWPD